MLIILLVYIHDSFVSELIALVLVPNKASEEPYKNPAENPQSPHEWVL